MLTLGTLAYEWIAESASTSLASTTIKVGMLMDGEGCGLSAQDFIEGSELCVVQISKI